MTECQYPIHLRRIGEPEIADYLESLVIEIDTHEKMFLELCQVKRERDAAVDALSSHRHCCDCGYYELQGYDCMRCSNHTSHPHWKWQGVQEVIL